MRVMLFLFSSTCHVYFGQVLPKHLLPWLMCSTVGECLFLHRCILNATRSVPEAIDFTADQRFCEEHPQSMRNRPIVGPESERASRHACLSRGQSAPKKMSGQRHFIAANGTRKLTMHAKRSSQSHIPHQDSTASFRASFNT